jgi:hypothetical protein
MMATLLLAETTVLGATFLRQGGAVSAVKVVNSSGQFTTSSPTYVDVPGLSLTLATPSGEHALFLMTFSSQSSVYGAITSRGYVRVLVDGAAAAPIEVQFYHGHVGDQYEIFSHQFVIGPLAAGKHNFVVQYHVDSNQNLFSLIKPMLSVLRAKTG